jgi:phage repressor protein C with HTH and peptisase S24 domain
MAPTEIGIERPLVLPVRYELQRTSREYQVIPNIEEPAKAGSAPSLKEVQRSVAANVAGVLAMDRAWMAEQLGRDDGGFATVTVSGHSMTPTLHDGDTIVIDTLVTNVEIDGIYVLRRGTTLVVKRITLKMDESAVISGDNEAHGSGEILQPATVRELRVVGRMVWPRFR